MKIKACDFINQYHRHHIAPQGMKSALGISNGQKLVRVLTAGNPISRHDDDELTLEVTRVCFKGAYVHFFAASFKLQRVVSLLKWGITP